MDSVDSIIVHVVPVRQTATRRDVYLETYSFPEDATSHRATPYGWLCLVCLLGQGIDSEPRPTVHASVEESAEPRQSQASNPTPLLIANPTSTLRWPKVGLPVLISR